MPTRRLIPRHGYQPKNVKVLDYIREYPDGVDTRELITKTSYDTTKMEFHLPAMIIQHDPTYGPRSLCGHIFMTTM